uniref:Uncharacterized protein n=1 Tax=Opuntia streptacantha TaxID=393608 RepID=A0A7C9E6F6_OPUST
MAYGKSRSVRFHNDMESGTFTERYNEQNNDHHPASIKQTYSIDGAKVQLPESLKMLKKESASSSLATSPPPLSLRTKVLARVFYEDYERVKRKILDPRGETIHRWNKVLLVVCLASLFVDPFFFFLPSVRDKVTCIDIEMTLELILTVVRSVADVFYVAQIYVKFRTAYVAPSSRIFGRGELIVDPWKIALRYVKGGFFIDLIAALPLPQVILYSLVRVN